MQQPQPPAPPPTAQVRMPPRIVARNEETPPRRADDKYDRQAENTIFAIAEDRRRLEAVTKERNDLYDANARASAQIDALREELKRKDEEIAHHKALTDSWHGEAMRLRSAGDLAMAAWAQAIGGGEREEAAQGCA